MMVEDLGQISVMTAWLTIVHVLIVLYMGVRNIFPGGVHRRETAKD